MPLEMRLNKKYHFINETVLFNLRISVIQKSLSSKYSRVFLDNVYQYTFERHVYRIKEV